MASPTSTTGKGAPRPSGSANSTAAEQNDAVEPDDDGADDSREETADLGADNGVDAAGETALGAKAESGLNSAHPSASNKEQRAREAEEDRALIAQAQKGNMAAFRRLVDRHQRRAFAIALGLVRDENDAREVVQEAFLRVYKGLATFEGSSSFFTWLYRIVTNLSIDLMRKPGRRAAELDETRNVSDESESELALVSRIDGADPVDVVRRKEIARRIQAALDSLPSYHRAVILMREVEGLSYEEMAEAMGVSKGTIMSRLFHARQKMQKALADVYAELDGSKNASRQDRAGGPDTGNPPEEAQHPAEEEV